MRVAVLGGGLQGACVALELASAGIAVDLYDKSDRCVSQASAQNEGKIHLGYVYANDRTLSTARMMARGAVTFSALLRRWLGSEADALPVSAPFHYVVHAESLLGVDEVETHLRRSHAIVLEESGGARPVYFGSDYRMPPARLSERACDALFDRRLVKAAFRTAEIAIDPEALAALIRTRLSADPKIRCFLQARVLGVERHARGGTVTFEAAGGRERATYDHVVNALWDGRLAVDRTAGLDPPRSWLYRVKHGLRLRAADVIGAGLPSVTVVLGPFGDTVAYGNGDLYLSWYPAGMRGTSSALSPPDWPLVLGEAAAREVRQATVEGLAGIIPAVAGLPPAAVASCEVIGGIIFAWGKTDIDDRASVLHERHAIGPRSWNRYHTVDTGKLTTAPLFAKRVADTIRQTG